MYLSKKWLSDFVDCPASAREFAEALTLSGSKVESFFKEGEGLSGIKVGIIRSLKPHPSADSLSVCSVDVGEKDCLQLITAAQNLKVGDAVPTALSGAVLADGSKIEARSLKGLESKGRFCSLAELGLSVHDFPYAREDSVFVLGGDCEKTAGLNISEAVGLNDTVTDFEITSNRPDCLSISGLARETAAAFDIPFRLHEPELKKGSGDVKDYLRVDIESPDTCSRYAGGVVRNVRIAPSPRWMRERLRACGVRPINNIVDITNYVMLEYGRPMHAFDLKHLKGGHVIVRTARDGESITTLDGTEHKLNPSITVIADEEKPVAVAGVMGGEFSGIGEDTETLVFESACFDGPAVRRAAKELGLRTEASARFEKQLSPDDCVLCLKRALELVQQLDAGDITEGYIDCTAKESVPVSLPFEPEWVNSFLGINLDAKKQAEILEKIGFTVCDGLIKVPYFRVDIKHKADIAEEIARFYGYNKIENRELVGTAKASLSPRQKFDRLLEQTMLGCGLSEIQTFSFISPKAYDRLCLEKDSPLRDCLTLRNPLGEDTSVMRTTALPSMLQALSLNFNNRNESAALYELATTYKPNGPDRLPDEDRQLVLGMYGDDSDFFTLKGITETLLRVCGISSFDIEPEKNSRSFHPGRTAKILVKGKQLALLGELHPKVLKNYEIEEKAYAALIDAEYLFSLYDGKKQYRPICKFPATSRDAAFVCPLETPVLELEKDIREAAGEILESIKLFDVFRGPQIGEGKKSVAFSLSFRSRERTLTDAECNEALARAIERLGKKGIVLRS